MLAVYASVVLVLACTVASPYLLPLCLSSCHAGGYCILLMWHLFVPGHCVAVANVLLLSSTRKHVYVCVVIVPAQPCHHLDMQVRSTAASLRKQLSDTPGIVIPGSSSSSTDSAASSESPVLHLQLSPTVVAAAGSRKAADGLLQAVADRLLDKHGLLVSVPRYSSLDRMLPPPSLKLYAHVGLTQDKVSKVALAVRESARHVLGPLLASL